MAIFLSHPAAFKHAYTHNLKRDEHSNRSMQNKETLAPGAGRGVEMNVGNKIR